MRITFITLGYAPRPSGGVKVIYEYANQLAARGHEVTVVHPRWLRKIRLRDVGQCVLTNLLRPRRLAGVGLQLLAQVHFWLTGIGGRHSPSSTIPHVPWHQLHSNVRLLLVPEPAPCYVPDGDAVFWYWGKDHPPEKGQPFHLMQGYGVFDKAQEDAVIRAPVPEIAIARWLYEEALRLGVPRDELIYIPNGIDHSKYRLVNPIDKRPARVAMMYSPASIKGPKDGVRALDLARQRFPALQAVLFGVCRRPRTLPGWIEYHRDPAQQELVEHIYNGSSIYLCPSWLEGFHLPPAEAMACGCALVSTDIGGVRDYAEDGVTALLSPPRQPEALAENLLRLLEDVELRTRLAKAGHERIQEFTWERSARMFEKFLIEKTQPSPQLALS
ncbi:MAG: hypothetical protein DRI40_06065 [Chloroflexi bacterium]|nr:MAG: hypothetical protein DRI40_06065 [Chloroflexota bacterium]